MSKEIESNITTHLTVVILLLAVSPFVIRGQSSEMKEYGPFSVTSGQWHSTGIHLKKGQFFRTSAIGKIKPGKTEYGPNGGGVWRWWVLRGKVGDKLFELGSEGTRRAPQDGQLELGFPRGASGKYHPEDRDIAGAFTVRVFVQGGVENSKPSGQNAIQGDVEILQVVGEAEISPDGDDSRAYVLKVGDRVRQVDRVFTYLGSRVKMRFPDGSIVTVGEITDMKVAAFRDAENLVRTRIWLRGGEISAEVNDESERPSDFEVKTPTATAGVRGTKFTTSYVNQPEPLTIVRVAKGLVEVTSVNPKVQPVILQAGAEARLSATTRSIRGPYKMIDRQNVAPAPNAKVGDVSETMGDGTDSVDWGPVNNQAALNGKTLNFYRRTTARQCQADCQKNARCAGFTFVRTGGYNPGDQSMCYLMSETSGFAPSSCCISAVKKKTAAAVPTAIKDLNPDKNRFGADYHNCPVPACFCGV